MTFTDGRGGTTDSGARIAERLGVDSIELDRDAWRGQPECEWEFFMADGKGTDVNWVVAESELEDSIFFQGQFADKLWTASDRDLAPDLKRGDRGGLAMTEYRLRVGFGHAHCPFWGALDSEIIHRISVSPEMEPWSVEASYNRPIPRRILETAGVPRGSFAQGKKMIGILSFWPVDLTTASRKLFQRFLASHGIRERRSVLRQRWERWVRRKIVEVNRESRLLSRLARKVLRTISPPKRLEWNPHFMPWAVSEGKRRLYDSPLREIRGLPDTPLHTREEDRENELAFRHVR